VKAGDDGNREQKLLPVMSSIFCQNKEITERNERWNEWHCRRIANPPHGLDLF
jgi:hypothetical protein